MSSGFGALLVQLRQGRKVSQRVLAARAEVSVKHVSSLERGEALPTREMTLVLANALELSIQMRNAMLHAAGFHGAYVTRDLPAVELDRLRKDVERMVSRMSPIPVIAIDSAWNILAINDAALTLVNAVFGLVAPAALLSGRQDALRATLMGNYVDDIIVNIDQLRRAVVARLRRDAAIEGPASDPAIALAELRTMFADLGESTDEELLAMVEVHLRDGSAVRKLLLVLWTIGNHHDTTYEGVRMHSFLPADDETGTWMRAKL